MAEGTTSVSDIFYRKRRKCTENNPKESSKQMCEDRISDLPDCIIQHILSFLPTKQSIRTSVLSKRWEIIWASVSTLSFDYNYRLTPRGACFIDRTLMHYRGCRINKFKLKVRASDINFKIDSWIRFATIRRVEELSLQLWGSVLPKFLYSYQFLVILSLRAFKLPPTACVSWKLLKRLSLSDSEVGNEVFASVLNGSPLLEYLKLENCSGIVGISSTSLRELEINRISCCFFCDHCGFYTMEICTPHLLSLTLSGYVNLGFMFIEVSSLIEATVSYEMDYDNPWMDLLTQLGHVPKIEFGYFYLLELVVDVRDSPLPASKSETITLEMDLKICNCSETLDFLKCFPHLRKLTINLMDCHSEKMEVRLFGLDKREWCTPRYARRFTRLVSQLKTIEITGDPDSLGSESGRLMVEFMIHNVKGLEKMVINADDNLWNAELKSQGMLELIKEISRYRISYRKVVIVSNFE